MRTIGDIDFLDDGEVRQELLWLSGLLIVVALAGGFGLGLAGAFGAGEQARLGGGAGGWALWVLVVIATSVVVLPVHELVHAALFVLFGGPGTRVRFGFQDGMLFAGCPGLVLARPKFCVVLAGPAVVLSAVLLMVPAALGLPLAGYVAFALHLSGCSGDLLAFVRALREPACTHVEDTDSGVRLLSRS